jgi:hypothetical protein
MGSLGEALGICVTWNGKRRFLTLFVLEDLVYLCAELCERENHETSGGRWKGRNHGLQACSANMGSEFGTAVADPATRLGDSLLRARTAMIVLRHGEAAHSRDRQPPTTSISPGAPRRKLAGNTGRCSMESPNWVACGRIYRYD